MRKIAAIMVMLALAGCAAGRNRLPAASSGSEQVTADGMAPVVNNDLPAAREAALRDAMKNALGLVVGVYVSQEALVAKAVLIEEQISAETAGYIERYTIVEEKRAGDFYQTRIQAQVRRESLAEKLKSLPLEARAADTTVRVTLAETMDGAPAAGAAASLALKQAFTAQGFTVTDAATADILVTGTAASTRNTTADLGGLISYRTVLALQAVKAVAGDVIATANESAAGVNVTAESAAQTAAANAVKRAAAFSQTVLTVLQNNAQVHLTIAKVENINALNDVLRSIRTLLEVRDCRVRSYAAGTAEAVAVITKGTATDLARRLERLGSVKIKILQVSSSTIDLELLHE
jgi:hypothetical protein